MYFTGWKKKDYKKNKIKCITAPILKPTYDQKPETFFGPKLISENTCTLKPLHNIGKTKKQITYVV